MDNSPTTAGTEPSAAAGKTQSWENEGGSIAPDRLLEQLGIVVHATETYSVGAYRYTNRADAVAQARRMDRAADAGAA